MDKDTTIPEIVLVQAGREPRSTFGPKQELSRLHARELFRFLEPEEKQFHAFYSLAVTLRSTQDPQLTEAQRELEHARKERVFLARQLHDTMERLDAVEAELAALHGVPQESVPLSPLSDPNTRAEYAGHLVVVDRLSGEVLDASTDHLGLLGRWSEDPRFEQVSFEEVELKK